MKSGVLFFLSLILSVAAHAASATQALRELPVQDAGRVKPFESFANESLELIFGRAKYEGKPAYEIIMTMLLQPQVWQDKPIFEIKHYLLKRALNLPAGVEYVSAEALLKNERLPMLMQELQSKRETKEKLDAYGQDLQRLENQLFVFRELASGRILKLAPASESEGWRSLVDLNPEEQAAFVAISKAFVAALQPGNAESAAGDLEKAVQNFETVAAKANPAQYANLQMMRTEVHYNDFHPFRWAWFFYLLSLISISLIWILKRPNLIRAGWVFAIIGLAFHVYGFGLRVYLTGRPPVSNMYETVVWVSFGTVVFAMIIEAVYRWRVALMAGTAVGAFCLILTNLAPTILDPGLHPLEPVLRSNYWLTIHVLTITISYAAFFLAFALGDIGLFLYLKDEKLYEERIRAIVMALYRAMQIGVALLAPGIILGGVWADYSWGRFWGWDPKETWALIALLGYIAVLHARLAGLIKNFGMVCTAVITFSLVIMAWYGVNFILGAGLHSYGFGAGGVEYVSGFVALHILFIIFVTMVRRGRQRAGKIA